MRRASPCWHRRRPCSRPVCSSPISISIRFIPFLLIVILLLAVGACTELHRLLQAVPHRPPYGLCVGGVFAVLLANWPVHMLDYFLGGAGLGQERPRPGPLAVRDLHVRRCGHDGLRVGNAAAYKDSSGAVPRIALAIWFVAYLGLLPSFLIQPLRWPPPQYGSLSMAIFVPKLGDVAAYFTGRFLGRHRLIPRGQSEEDVGGLPRRHGRGDGGGPSFEPFLSQRTVERQVFVRLPDQHGIARRRLGGVGFRPDGRPRRVFGDLAESLIWRDCHRKDTADTVPGFGGVLDVIDSILFAAHRGVLVAAVVSEDELGEGTGEQAEAMQSRTGGWLSSRRCALTPRRSPGLPEPALAVCVSKG